MSDTRLSLQPGDFVSTGKSYGCVDKVSDAQILVTTYNRLRGGWEPTNTRVNHKIGTLTKIAALQAPKGQHRHMRVVNRTQDTAELLLYADIGDSMWASGISDAEFAGQLKSIGAVKNLDIRMNSAGGDVFVGYSIYRQLVNHSARITVHVDGLAASIASIIAMAADEIVMYDTSTVMIHKPWTMAGGDANDLKDVVARLDLVEGQMLDIYAKRTGLSRDHLTRLLAAETWMNGEEAVALGFADRIDSAMPEALAASVKQDFDKQWFAHAPKQTISNPELQETICRAKRQSVSLLSRSRSVA